MFCGFVDSVPVSIPRREGPQWHLREPARRSDRELLAAACGSEDAAARLMQAAGSLRNLLSWREAEFEAVKGLGPARAAQVVACLEIARRASLDVVEQPQLTAPDRIAAFMEPLARGLQVEKFWVLCMNRKNRVIKCVEVTSGTATSALAHPREVFREAVRESATAIICVHNHPSGDPAPSAADLQVTRQLRDAARALDIDLLDHVILGRASADPVGLGHYSFRTAGTL